MVSNVVACLLDVVIDYESSGRVVTSGVTGATDHEGVFSKSKDQPVYGRSGKIVDPDISERTSAKDKNVVNGAMFSFTLAACSGLFRG